MNSERLRARLLSLKTTLETDMLVAAHRSEAPSAVRTDLNAIFVSLELSQSKWLITSLSPGNGERLSKFVTAAREVAGLLACFAELQRKTEARTGRRYAFVVIQEAGLDGFWLHRVLEAEKIESYVVDPASIAVPRRKRRVKTDRIDGEMLLRTLLAYMRGDPRVCAMVRAPSPEEEDRRRVSRERKSLTNERIRHVNRIEGLLYGQGIESYEPLRRDRRKRLEELTTGDGRPLGRHLKAQINRELDRLELILRQLRQFAAIPCRPSRRAKRPVSQAQDRNDRPRSRLLPQCPRRWGRSISNRMAIKDVSHQALSASKCPLRLPRQENSAEINR